MKKSKVKAILTIVGNLGFAVTMVLLVVILFFVIQGRITSEAPRVGASHIYNVLSGSMEPTIKTGAIVIIKSVDTAKLAVGDIITFKENSDSDKLITHRLVKINEDNDDKKISFITKGDANNAEDQQPVLQSNIVGKVAVSIPYAGYVMEFARSKNGILLMIIIPGVLIIILEMINLVRYLVKHQLEKKETESNKPSSKQNERGTDNDNA